MIRRAAKSLSKGAEMHAVWNRCPGRIYHCYGVTEIWRTGSYLVVAARVQDHAAAGVHSLDDDVVQHHLLLRPLQDVLLNTPTGDKSIDVDGFFLPYPVGSAHGLKVILRAARSHGHTSVSGHNKYTVGRRASAMQRREHHSLTSSPSQI